MKTLPYLRVSSGFVFLLALCSVFASLVLIKFLRLARYLFVTGLWLLTVMSAPGIYLLIQFLEEQGVAFSTAGTLYLVVYIVMLIAVVYSSMILNRGGMSVREVRFARAPIVFISAMSFVLIGAVTVFYIPIAVQQCNKNYYRYKLGIYECDFNRQKQKGSGKLSACHTTIVSFEQDNFAYFRWKPVPNNRCRY
ncbi:hypothetical protein MNBD_GAMMA12-3673 [hydrothermal vent metagenome]|uniref:Uncharacterized protein n=1 Tax=hydrothermal vent metagenome TaxID=652676 RepID=A0A3B0YK21_9ZZZZ